MAFLQKTDGMGRFDVGPALLIVAAFVMPCAWTPAYAQDIPRLNRRRGPRQARSQVRPPAQLTLEDTRARR